MRWTASSILPKLSSLATDAHGHRSHAPGEKASNHYERSLLHRGRDGIFQRSVGVVCRPIAAQGFGYPAGRSPKPRLRTSEIRFAHSIAGCRHFVSCVVGSIADVWSERSTKRPTCNQRPRGRSQTSRSSTSPDAVNGWATPNSGASRGGRWKASCYRHSEWNGLDTRKSRCR